METDKIYTYKEVMEHLEELHGDNILPMTLIIGDKRFNGVEIPGGEYYKTWLFINAVNDVEFLDEDFKGKDFDIYGETRGKDFRVMGKSIKKKRRDVPDWSRNEWKEYINGPIQFEIVYADKSTFDLKTTDNNVSVNEGENNIYQYLLRNGSLPGYGGYSDAIYMSDGIVIFPDGTMLNADED